MEIAVLSLGLDIGENSEDRGEVGMRRTVLLSLDLNRRHEDEGGEDADRYSKQAQTPRRTCNQEADDVTVQSPRRQKTHRWSQEVHQTHAFPPAFTNRFIAA